MDVDLQAWMGGVERGVRPALALVLNPAFGIQLALALTLFVIARLLARRLEPALEARARTIRGQPGLLRVAIAVLRRLHWALYVVMLLAAYAVLRAAAPRGDTYPLYVVLLLASAWLLVSVASRVIRNRFVARLVRWLVWIYAAITILRIGDETAAVLDGLDIQLGAMRLSALLLIKAALLVTLALWIAITVANFIDARVQRADELTPSLRVLIGKVTKIVLVVAAGAIALTSIGVDLTALTVFSGAVGVGIGFGLQKVVSNFVSGVIILLDKSIKPGDTITVGDTFGWIRDLRARFVSIVTRDGREYLIPNEDFITQKVVNWSFTDDLVRLDVKFGVSYDSDPHAVSELAIEAASSVPRVESARRPVCWLTGFGDSSLDFVLRFWIHDPQQGLTNVRGKVLMALWDTFKANGVEIPFPQREVLVKRGSRLEMPAEARPVPPGDPD